MTKIFKPSRIQSKTGNAYAVKCENLKCMRAVRLWSNLKLERFIELQTVRRETSKAWVVRTRKFKRELIIYAEALSNFFWSSEVEGSRFIRKKVFNYIWHCLAWDSVNL